MREIPMTVIVKSDANDDERAELVAAADRNCECTRGYGVTLSMCAIHVALTDEIQVGRLLFVRRMRERLQREEGTLA